MNFKILVVDDEKDVRESMEMLLASQKYIVKTAASGEEALEILENEFYSLVISDIMMAGMDGIALLHRIKELYKTEIEVIMLTAHGSIGTAVQAIKAGAFGYFIKGNSPEELLLEIKKAKTIIELKANRDQQDQKNKSEFLLTSRNKQMQEVWEMVRQVAETNANVLITGETGVGKEIVAHQLHVQSQRKDKLFIPMNCKHYPENLMKSELFGYEKGAFTGAINKRVGKIEASNGGTIFMDEIGEMDLSTQIALLRVLETKKIERIGSNRLVDVDFRLVSATNRNLPEAVEKGLFREDFLYRINTIEIRIPPLRERREDLPDLIQFFLEKFERETSKKITEIPDTTMKYLLEHEYDGNIRELKNTIERLVILSKDGRLNLLQQDTKVYATHFEPQNEIMQYKEAKQAFEQKYILEVLESCEQNISKAAQVMGISRRQLFNKITEYKIVVK